MKTSAPPLAPWLKWVCGLLGLLLIAGALAALPFTGLALWLSWHAPAGSSARSAQILGVLLGRLTGEVLLLALGGWLLRRAWPRKSRVAEATAVPASGAVGQDTPAAGSNGTRGAHRWPLCNVFQAGEDARELWAFHASGDSFKLGQHEVKLPNEPLNARLVGKDWQTLYRPKLNLAWVALDKVFLRAVQIPAADAAEAASMIELQLEKLSPIPPQQAVWTFELLPGKLGPLRTAVVTIVERTYIEQFLGKLEEQGYQADRLEVPFVDQLLATKTVANGVWVYPGLGADQEGCVVAWWYGGVLYNVSLLRVPPEPEAGRYLRRQLGQMGWAGEVEGWLTAPPRWHLVAGPELAVTWEPWLREEGQAVERVSPLSSADLAARSARRAVAANDRPRLLPSEYAARYRQQFIDRIWMRCLGAVMMVILVGTVGYLGVLQFYKYRIGTVETEVNRKRADYDKAMKIMAEVRMLQDQVDLQYAALECWKAVATLLPEELTLDSINFQRGRTLTVSGHGPEGAGPRATDYNEALRNATYKDEKIFSKVMAPDIRPQPNEGIRWTLTAEVKRANPE